MLHNMRLALMNMVQNLTEVVDASPAAVVGLFQGGSVLPQLDVEFGTGKRKLRRRTQVNCCLGRGDWFHWSIGLERWTPLRVISGDQRHHPFLG